MRPGRGSSISFALSHTYVSVGHQWQRKKLSFVLSCLVTIQRKMERPAHDCRLCSNCSTCLFRELSQLTTCRILPSTERDAERGNEVRSPKFIWAPVYIRTNWPRPRNSHPLPPHLGSYTSALLVSQNRRHYGSTMCVT
jgi:hypothetical protein